MKIYFGARDYRNIAPEAGVEVGYSGVTMTASLQLQANESCEDSVLTPKLSGR